MDKLIIIRVILFRWNTTNIRCWVALISIEIGIEIQTAISNSTLETEYCSTFPCTLWLYSLAISSFCNLFSFARSCWSLHLNESNNREQLIHLYLRLSHTHCIISRLLAHSSNLKKSTECHSLSWIQATEHTQAASTHCRLNYGLLIYYAIFPILLLANLHRKANSFE